MRAIILSIGDELILGQVTDTNAGWLGARLAECGIMTAWQPDRTGRPRGHRRRPCRGAAGWRNW